MLLLIENPSTERLFCVYDDSLRRRGDESSRSGGGSRQRGKIWPPQATEITEGGGLVFFMLCALGDLCGSIRILARRAYRACPLFSLTDRPAPRRLSVLDT